MPGAPTILTAIDDLGPQDREIGRGTTTGDNTPTFKIGFDGSAHAGDTITLLLVGSTGEAQYTLTATDVANGYARVTSQPLGNGPHEPFSATLTDASGAASAQSQPYTFDVWAFQEPPADARSTTLTDGTILKSFTSPDIWGQATVYLQRYDSIGDLIGTQLHFENEDLHVGNFRGFYSVTPLANGAYLATLTEGAHFPNSVLKLIEGDQVVNTLSVNSLGDVWAGTHGGFVLSSTVFNPSQVSYLQAFDAGGTATSPKINFFGPVQSITSNPSGTIDVAWRDPNGGDHVTAIDPTHPTGLADPAAPGVSLLDNEGPQTGVVISGATTDDATPTFRVAVSQAGAVGVRVIPGLASTNVAVTADDAAPGYVEVTPSSPLREGVYRSEVSVGDSNGLASEWRPVIYTVQSLAHQGTSGADTETADAGGSYMTGGAGADVFVFKAAGGYNTVTDFTLGADKLDVSALLSAAGYHGSDPIADGYLKVLLDGGSYPYPAFVQFDADGAAGSGAAVNLVQLNAVDYSKVTLNDFITSGSTSPPPPPSGGQTLQAQPGGSNLQGGSGDDTLIGGAGPDTMTGAGGGDHFVFQSVPWNPGHITDFTHGTDKLDLSALLSQAGYTGSDPIADGYVRLYDDGQGDSWLHFDSDGRGTADEWGSFIATLDHVAPSGVTGADLVGSASPPPPPPPSGGGQTLQGQPGGSHLTGGSGDDTLIGGMGPDVMTGAAGADHFTFDAVPWHAAQITDFTHGSDKLDLSALLSKAGYSGADPVADGYVKFLDDGQGDTWLYFDATPASNPWGDYVATLQHVSPSSLGAADLVGTAASPPPPPPAGQTLQGQAGGSNLKGGAGDDTLIGGVGPDTMTGAGGADHFVYQSAPWQGGQITDFTNGTDKIDVSGLLAGVHYSGSDPIADGYVRLYDNGSGGTWLYFDSDGPGTADQWGTFVANLSGVSPSRLTGSDFIFH
jgi:Ca2+-binding RTX toxin-like protein